MPTERDRDGAARAKTSPPRRFHDDEEGTIVLATVVAILFFVVLLGLVANVGQAVRRKVTTQNAADAVALSAATVRARALNAVTATNHLIGELEALVVLHHAIGGDEMDRDGSPDQDPSIQDLLETAHVATLDDTDEPKPEDQIWEAFKQDLARGEGATLHDSFLRLKQVMTWIYETYAVAGVLKDIPYTKPLGYMIAVAAKLFEVKAYVEWEILKMLADLARGLVDLKKSIQDDIIPDLYQLQGLIGAELPGRVRATRDAVAAANGVAAAVYPFPTDLAAAPPPSAGAVFQIPVHPEPESVEPVQRSQLVRAAFPWVAHWRRDVLDKMKEWLFLSEARKHYLHHSNAFMPAKARELKDRHGVHLPVLAEYELGGDEKGNEPWTGRDGSDQADALFGATAFARRSAPKVIVAGIYPKLNPDGIVTHSQALTYNGNPQEPGTAGRGLQPKVGWDTLNWAVPVAECPTDPDAEAPTADFPRVRLNWQAKLVPARADTLRVAAERVSAAEPPFGAVLEKALPFLGRDPFLTH